MYIHRMVRTQLYLDEAVHSRLSALARKQGRTLSELVRDALLRIYGTAAIDERLATVRAIEGLWRNRRDVGNAGAYVRQLRRDTHRLRRGRV
jgi:ribbon-helix-helix CopG family protein